MSVSELEQLDRRAREAERPIIEALLAWVLTLRKAVTPGLLSAAIRTGATGAVLSAVRGVAAPNIDLGEYTRREGAAALRLVVDRAPPDRRIQLRFDVRDPKFELAVYEHQARLVREVTDSVRTAIARIVAEAYRRGVHPDDFAPRIHETVGLTSRQSVAVLNYSHGLERRGTPKERIDFQSARYARRLRAYRAQLIARTETIRAANVSRIAGFRQAAAAGLVNAETATLVWDATLDRRVCPICRALDGVESALAEPSFNGSGPPPLHPACRCVVNLA